MRVGGKGMGGAGPRDTRWLGALGEGGKAIDREAEVIAKGYKGWWLPWSEFQLTNQWLEMSQLPTTACTQAAYPMVWIIHTSSI